MMLVMTEVMTEIDRLTQTIPNYSIPRGIYKKVGTYLAFGTTTNRRTKITCMIRRYGLWIFFHHTHLRLNALHSIIKQNVLCGYLRALNAFVKTLFPRHLRFPIRSASGSGV